MEEEVLGFACCKLDGMVEQGTNGNQRRRDGVLTIAVDPDGPSPESVTDADGPVKVSGMQGSGETINSVVGLANSITFILEFCDRTDRAKDLLAANGHARGNVTEDRGLDEIALITETLTASFNSSALLFTLLNITHDAITLCLADLGPLEGVFQKRISYLMLQAALLEGLEELFIDAFLHEKSSPSTTTLPLVIKDAVMNPLDCVLNIGVIEYDVG